MSRSTKLLTELSDGLHLVAVGTIENTDYDAVAQTIKIRFSDGSNQSHEKVFKLDDKHLAEFDKMTSAAKIDRTKDLKLSGPGSRLYITIKDGFVDDYMPFVEGVTPSVIEEEPIVIEPVKEETKSTLPPEKLEAIAKAKAMIKGVESGKKEEVKPEIKKDWADF